MGLLPGSENVPYRREGDTVRIFGVGRPPADRGYPGKYRTTQAEKPSIESWPSTGASFPLFVQVDIG
jgi:hypothetical protein